MTSFEIQNLVFKQDAITNWAALNARHVNWPVVYTIIGDSEIYIGETLNASGRLRQHLESPERQVLKTVRVVVDDSFNKSACLDLESSLIRLFAGDGNFKVLNRNEGITESNYFDRENYQSRFSEIYEQLIKEGLFSKSVPEIENSDLFKLSPFKALTQDQGYAVEYVVDTLFKDLNEKKKTVSVIHGGPGTGKTVVGIYLLKLLQDIADTPVTSEANEDSLFSRFFDQYHADKSKNLRIGIVIPQQALRKSVEKVFRKTPGLKSSQVLSPFDLGKVTEPFDVLVVDEAHRLSQRANQPSAALNRKFEDINKKLFGKDDPKITQLDWVKAVCKHTVLLLDVAQTVRPADLPMKETTDLLVEAELANRLYRLTTQMRLKAAENYVEYVRAVLASEDPNREHFEEYDLRLFDKLPELYAELTVAEQKFGLSRLVAGFAWPWASKNNKKAFDIDIDGMKLRWNSTHTDWVNSTNAFNEVGSIHTVQGYDLNYAGVIIGSDLKYDSKLNRIIFDRQSYFDSKGKENNPRLGIFYSDDDLLGYVSNIYAVLLTRGIRGTFVYCCDEPLREYLKKYFPVA